MIWQAVELYSGMCLKRLRTCQFLGHKVRTTLLIEFKQISIRSKGGSSYVAVQCPIRRVHCEASVLLHSITVVRFPTECTLNMQAFNLETVEHL